jgi:hypothetical protein
LRGRPVRVVVTVDTEADGQWEHGRPLATANVAAWPPFQELCQRHAVRPTYLITSEIADDPEAVAFLRPLAEAGHVEVGSHLHPWSTPPFAEEPGLRENDREHAYPCHLEADLLLAKLETLTAQVAQATGARPTSYRAGRFGLDAAGARLLAGLGYEVDSSVTPFVTWAANAGRPGRGGGPDFRRHDASPFRVAGTGSPGLVEVPVTIMPTYAVTRRVRWLREHWQALVVRAERVRLPCAVFMFHSSELLAGASPYRPTQDDVDALLRLLDGLLAWCRDRGHEFATLSAAGRVLAASAGLPVKEL